MKMQMISSFIFLLSMIFINPILSKELTESLGECLSNLTTHEIAVSYNYLHLSSKFGTAKAYPGFSSLFIKLSDDDSSKGHDLAKFLALRRAKVARLISKTGIQIRSGMTSTSEIYAGLQEARQHNRNVWNEVINCHGKADSSNDAHVQDYLESHFLDHHVEIDKLLSDIEHRIQDAQPSERSLIIFMIDEELLHTYGDRRKNVFS